MPSNFWFEIHFVTVLSLPVQLLAEKDMVTSCFICGIASYEFKQKCKVYYLKHCIYLMIVYAHTMHTHKKHTAHTVTDIIESVGSICRDSADA